MSSDDEDRNGIEFSDEDEDQDDEEQDACTRNGGTKEGEQS